ncbi:hypothetical protein IAD21_00602 [Abditibacteriota bacterium]|nr:hypothetical protein IAD21_00602 [Abditibacteriota bacterium]
MSRITEAHRISAHLPDSDLYDLTIDDAVIRRLQNGESLPVKTIWMTCRRCDGPFPTDRHNRLICGNCRLSENEL